MAKFNVREKKVVVNEVEVKAGKGFDVQNMLNEYVLHRYAESTPVIISEVVYPRESVGARPIKRVAYKCGVKARRNHNHKWEGVSARRKITRTYELEPQKGLRVYTHAPYKPELQHSLVERTYDTCRFIDGRWVRFARCKRWTDPVWFAAFRMKKVEEFSTAEMMPILERSRKSIDKKFHRTLKEKKWDVSELPKSMSGKPWTAGEVKILCNMRKTGYNFETIARVLARTRNAVYMKYYSI